jgi:hypothetical protein
MRKSIFSSITQKTQTEEGPAKKGGWIQAAPGKKTGSQGGLATLRRDSKKG